MRFTFWGTRGSIAVPGPDTLRYGGNTTCLQVEPSSGTTVIIDAGSGIRPLGLELCKHNSEGELLLLITHLHWDHILGFLFFDPAYHPGWRVRVCGWPKALAGLKSIFNSRHADGNFPVDWDDLPGVVEMADELELPRFVLNGMEVCTTPLNHPQGGLGFRFQEKGRAFTFITDNELKGPGQTQMDDFVKFVAGSRVLVHDAQYLPEEMPERYGYGHSDYTQAVELARKAGVERLILTHHDPSRSDEQVEALLNRAREIAGTDLQVDAAREGLVVEV
jgi:phosphoribosyl 1,2-cyclic phosphodiesterase